MANGYNGKILRVNLTDGMVKAEAIDELFCRRFMGGAGFITYYLTKELASGVDPLGPENKLMFMAGPLTGLPFSGSGRNCVGAKSPLALGLAKSEVGGFFGAEMRHAGFDGIIVEGKAAKPVYLFVHDGEAQIKDAGKLWGKTTKETEEAIRAELGDGRIRVASIGPAGENMVRFASIMNDLKESAGRGGTGAVMGSKNLKAIAARGTKIPETAKPDTFNDIRGFIRDNPKLYEVFSQFGTGAPAGMISGLAQGNLPVRNFRDGVFPDVEKITAGTIKDTIRVGMEGCYACVVRCKKMVKVDEPGMKIDPDYGGPEYESLAALGSTCGVGDLKAICKANELCGAYSLDTISTGVVIGFAMECYERGLLTNRDTGGVELRFGSAEAMMKAVELIARREGIGDLLAEGVKRASERLGHGSSAFAMHAKGLEVPMHDPRAKAALGLGYAVNPHGADHCANIHDTGYAAAGPQLNAIRPWGFLEPLPADDLGPKKVNLFRLIHNQQIVKDCAVICMFVPYTMDQVLDMLKGATGWDMGMVELLQIADRVWTLSQMFNLRQGLNEADDRLPERIFTPHIGGPASAKKAYSREALERARKYYYSIMGWNEKGVPTSETLEALDIAWAGAK